MEIRIAAIGNVDSAKSTTIGCLSHDILDDGRGLARSKILKHKHESETGRTSSITQYYIRKNNKVICFTDLAGHEKYLKTTAMGLSGCYIDYALVTIGGDRGIIGMTKEHLQMAVALNIPIFIVITKIDISPGHKLEKIINRITKIMSSNAAGNLNCKIITEKDSIESLKNFSEDKICPIFLTSNTLGTNLNNLKNFVYSLKNNYNWDLDSNKTVFTIDDSFKVKGIGLVISGTMKEGNINVDKKYLIGPFNGDFKQIIVKSIHNNFREHVNTLSSSCSGCLAIKVVNKKDKIDKELIKKGMVILSNKESVIKFKAEILVLNHPTTIRLNYQPVIHCGLIRQSAIITKMSKKYIRTGDKAIINFKFKYHPEWLELGDKIIFREGNTKGVGKIIEIN